jgi:hypothetical protein
MSIPEMLFWVVVFLIFKFEVASGESEETGSRGGAAAWRAELSPRVSGKAPSKKLQSSSDETATAAATRIEKKSIRLNFEGV